MNTRIILLLIIIIAVAVALIGYFTLFTSRVPQLIINQAEEPKTMTISSSAFDNNGNIPSQYTCEGANFNPLLTFGGVPEDTKSLALIMDDPDAPNGTWVHWTLWNMSPLLTNIPEQSYPADAVQGRTSTGDAGYHGPCPPSGTHHYHFKLYALDTTLAINPDTDKAGLESVMEGHVLDRTELVGLYKKENL